MSRPVDRCLDEQELDEFLLGRLEGAELDSVEQHLLFCAACQDRVEQEQVFARDLRAALREPVEAPRKPVRWVAPVGLAAAVLVGIGLVMMPGGPVPARGPIQTVELTLTRSAQVTEAPAGKPFQLSLDVEQIAQNTGGEVAVVNAAGREVFRAAGERREGRMEVRCRALSPGAYWVRLMRGDELLREYGLQVR